MPSHTHSTSSDSTLRVRFARDAQEEACYRATNVYPRRASQSLQTTHNHPSFPSSQSRMAPGHSRDTSNSSMESASSTASFFPTLSSSQYAHTSHTARHHYSNSGSSMSSFEYPVLEKQKTIDLPPCDESPVVDSWAELQTITIRAKMKAPFSALLDWEATSPVKVTSMLVAVEGLEAFDPVSIQATGAYLTAKEVVEGVLRYLEAPVTVKELTLLNEDREMQLASGTPRYQLLSEGVKVAFQGFTFDVKRNKWVLHRSY
ncbi:hypothetical protein BDZ89DRAFT_1068137 [Hymenopellis radicata]|nr:hypothetical protein BDZ89DRAFT_1068137 [Hymenopellis radicata]